MFGKSDLGIVLIPVTEEAGSTVVINPFQITEIRETRDNKSMIIMSNGRQLIVKTDMQTLLKELGKIKV